MIKKSTVRLSFHGAAGTVTGSKFLLEWGQKKILVDCGLFQGKKDLRLLNWQKTHFDPAALDAIVLTHAHIDHTGCLPLVVKRGFRGPIYCTAATKALLELLLPDSAHLQEEEARYAAEHKTTRHNPPLPLYTQADARQALSQLRVFQRDKVTELMPGLSVEARCAGHILGSCSLAFELEGRRVVFSGDVGRFNSPLLPDPAAIAMGDVLICESTYGDTVHADSDVKEEFARVVKQAVSRGGPLLIPAFAIGRTQTLLYFLSELEREGAIPQVPVFVDSPMACDATEIYQEFKHDFDEAARALERGGHDVMRTARTAFVQTVEQSKRLNSQREPAIIISASGMVNGGRILHHMNNWLDRENATILFVGFQAEGTRGRLIQSGAKEVKFFGRYVPVRAKVESISGLSAHADRSELLRWLGSCAGSPKVTRIVHGEPVAARAFAKTLVQEKKWSAQVAEYLEVVEL